MPLGRPIVRPTGARVRSTNGILYPLDILCARAGAPQPAVRPISAEGVPPPYHALLVHEDEMTQTLERHIGGAVALRALSSFRQPPWYYRRVLLADAATGRPVIMGAVGIRVDRFRAAVRAQIHGEQVPLGRVLREAGLDYRSRPKAFFEVTPTPEIMGIFWMREPRTLYGRQTDMLLGSARIGNIVEILPCI
jgi:chorismate-pyruvate lyase